MGSKWPLLLRPKLLSIRNAITQERFARRIPLLLIIAVIWALFYLAMHEVAGYLLGFGAMGDAVALRLLGMIFYSLLGFLFLSTTVTALSTIYLSADLQLIRRMPVADGDILIFKAIETVTISSWMAFSFMPPVLIAFGAAYGAGLYYYLMSLILFLFFVLITAGCGMLVAHVLSRVFPPGRAREGLVLLGIAGFALFYFLVRSRVPVNADDPLKIVEMMTSFNTSSLLLPSYWLTESLRAMLRGRAVDAVYPLALVSSAMFLPMLAHLVGCRFFRVNIERVRPDGVTARRATQFPRRGHAFVYKDLKLFMRDTSQWSQVLIIVALVLIYLYNFKALPLGVFAGTMPYIREVFALINVLMSGMVLAAVAGRFVYPAISLEGRVFWMAQAAPISMKRFVIGKLIFWGVPVVALSTSIVFVANILIGVDGMLNWLSTAAVFVLSISVSGLGLGLGAMYPVFEYDNVQSVSVGAGAIVFMFLAICLVTFTTGALGFAYYLPVGDSETFAALGALVAIVVNVAAFYFPLRLGIRNLERLGA